MILATHAIVGATIATTLTSDPYIAFGIGFTSHFLLDPIPHWDYKLYSFKKDPLGSLQHDMVIGKTFLIDLLRVGIDAMIGVIISLILFTYIFETSTPYIILAGAIGGILPDPLQFVYWKTKSKILLPLQKFHKKIHGRSLTVRPLYGILLQILVVTIFLSIAMIIRK